MVAPQRGQSSPGAAVHLQRHRQLVRDLVADHLLVVLERRAQHVVARRVQPLARVGVELGPLLERRQPRGPEQLVHPGPPDPGDRALVAQQRVEVAGLVEQTGELVQRRRRVGVRAERRDRVVGPSASARQQLRPGPLLGAELAQAQLAPALEPDQQPRGPVAQRRPVVPELEPSRRHQVDQDDQLARVDHEHLAGPAHAGDRPARERVERRVERLHRDHARARARTRSPRRRSRATGGAP